MPFTLVTHSQVQAYGCWVKSIFYIRKLRFTSRLRIVGCWGMWFFRKIYSKCLKHLHTIIQPCIYSFCTNTRPLFMVVPMNQGMVVYSRRRGSSKISPVAINPALDCFRSTIISAVAMNRAAKLPQPQILSFLSVNYIMKGAKTGFTPRLRIEACWRM